MMKRSQSSTMLGLITFLMSQHALAQAQVEITLEANQYKVQFCDSAMAAKSMVGFQLTENGIIQKEFLNEKSCVTKMYSNSSLNSGQKLRIHKMVKSSEDSQGTLYTGTLSETKPSNQGENSKKTTTYMDGVKYEITTVEKQSNGEAVKIKIKVCHPDFPPRVAVNVTNRATLGSSRNVSKSSYITADKCFETDYLKGEVQDGDLIGIGFSDANMKTIELTLRGVPWKRSSVPTPVPTPSPAPQPNPGGSTGTTGPVLKVESREEIQFQAQQAADRFATSVAKTLGRVENIRYNLYVGFQNEKLNHERYGYSVEGSRYYKDGYQDSYRSPSIKDAGYNQGRIQAATMANDLAKSDVGSAVDQAIEARQNGGVPRLQVQRRTNLQSLEFSGLQPNIARPLDVKQRFEKSDIALEQELKNQYLVIENGFILRDDDTKGYLRIGPLFSVADFRADLYESSFRTSNAFDMWAQGLFQQGSRDVAYYSSISNENTYQNALGNKQIYRNAFEARYNQIIKKKMDDAIYAKNPNIQKRSADLYVQYTNEFAYDLGSYKGHVDRYKQASQDGFYNSIEREYNQAIDSTVQAVQSNYVMTDIKVIATSSNGDSIVTIGETVDLVLQFAANRGMRDGAVVISPMQSNEVAVLKSSASQAVPAFSKLRTPTTYKEMMMISRLSNPDQAITVTFNVNGRTYTANLQARFEELVMALARSSSGSVQNSLVGHLVQFLRQEWDRQKSIPADGFNDGKGTLLIERMARQTMLMNSAEQANFKRFATQIKSAYGDNGNRPSGLFNHAYKNDFDSAMKLLKQAGLN